MEQIKSVHAVTPSGELRPMVHGLCEGGFFVRTREMGWLFTEPTTWVGLMVELENGEQRRLPGPYRKNHALLDDFIADAVLARCLEAEPA